MRLSKSLTRAGALMLGALALLSTIGTTAAPAQDAGVQGERNFVATTPGAMCDGWLTYNQLNNGRYNIIVDARASDQAADGAGAACQVKFTDRRGAVVVVTVMVAHGDGNWQDFSFRTFDVTGLYARACKYNADRQAHTCGAWR